MSRRDPRLVPLGRPASPGTPLDLVRAASILILLLGFVDLALLVFLGTIQPDAEGSLAWLFVMHFASTLFLPWTPRESVNAIGPVFWRGSPSSSPRHWRESARHHARRGLAPLVLLPGMLLAHVRMRRWSRRFRSEAFKRRFLSLRREMSQARIMHESLFPDPSKARALDFDFDFKPMRDLGGDFIHASQAPMAVSASCSST